MAPVSTYRLQLHAGFGFDDAAAVAGYLSRLGVSHLYASPYLQAAPGSTHGYDVVDHHKVNEELGGAQAHERLCLALAANDLGQVLDIVPNHMAITGAESTLWWDVLENGPSSRYAAFFDVDWDPPESKLRNKVLMPILGDHYGRVLEAGEILLAREGGSFTFRYYDHLLPVDPQSLDDLLEEAAWQAGCDELAFLAHAARRLPVSTATEREPVAERDRDKQVLRSRIGELTAADPPVADAVDAAVARLNADHDRLDALLERQNYRLAFWRTAGRELDYRRFFNIASLVGLRVEDEEVFDHTHALVLRFIHRGVLGGLRVDHPDGLRDPESYFRRLRNAAPEAWVVAEKILEPGERLPSSWAVAGTTGYDFLNRLGGLFVDPSGQHPLTELYAQTTGEETDYETVAHSTKSLVIREELAAELNRLTNLFVRVCEANRRYRDYTRHELRQVLGEVIACFPVYRTYVRAEKGAVSSDDAAHVEEAIGRARGLREDLDPDLFDFLRDVLLLRCRGEVESELVMSFQQATGAIMAKGVEDTAFYVYNRLTSLNEVGGAPGRFGTSLEEFHAACSEAQHLWPEAMTTTSTHDTKRSEDVRARISLLSEIPERWSEAVTRFRKLAEAHKTPYMSERLPDANAEYLLYQTLVGAHPLELGRAVAYMEKASREAKVHTSWVDPNPIYDEALRRFVEGILQDEAFTQELSAFVEPLVGPGRVNALSQKLIALTAPGVPDVYQGTELWDLSLVDPDNRRPVDFSLRARLLEELDSLSVERVLERADEGLPKLLVVRRALELRRRRRELFGAEGSYEALTARGEKASHVIAFARGAKVITIAPRLVLGLGGDWADTHLSLPPGRWRNLLTDENVEDGRLEAILARFPVALLVAEGS